MNDCARVAAYLESGAAYERAAPPADVREHLQVCSGCRQLWDFAADAEVAEVDVETSDRIQRKLLETLEPVKPLPSRVVLALLFVAIFVGVSALAVLAVGGGAAAAMTSQQLLGMLAAILLAAGFAGFWLSGEMSPGEKRSAGIVGLCGASLLGLGLAASFLFPWDTPQNLWAGGFKCFRAGFLLSIPAVAPVAFLISRGFPLSLRSVGAAAGLLAGLVGFLFLHMECSLYAAPHVLLGHLTAPLAGALAGYLGGWVIELMRRVRAAEA
jgi:hypothetical protein